MTESEKQNCCLAAEWLQVCWLFTLMIMLLTGRCSFPWLPAPQQSISREGILWLMASMGKIKVET